MILEFGMEYQELEVYKVYISNEPGLILTNFTAQSNFAAYVS